MSDLRFDGRVAIVTGAGGVPSLGRAYAHLLAARGAKVVVNDLGVGPDGRGIQRADAELVAQEIRDSGGEAVADTHSVAEPDSAAAVVQTALDAWGRIDILVNNAGVLVMCGWDEISPNDIGSVVNAHLLGNIWMCRAAWGHMVKRGYGRIVNVCSGSMFGNPLTVVYGAAKGGIFSLTRGLAASGAEHGIRVNAVAPGALTIASIYSNVEGDPWVTQMREQAPAELVAPTLAFLAHEECPVSGRCLSSSMGHVAEIFYDQTEGYTKADLTIEDVHEHLKEILAGGAATSRTGDPVERAAQDRGRFTPKPYVPA